jgi:hypothetical protein
MSLHAGLVPPVTVRPDRLGARVRTGQTILTAILALSAVVALSTVFVDDPFEPAAVVLIASFGVLAAVLGIASVWGGIRSGTVQVAVWAVPLFFVSHIATLGTWVPDAIFAVVSAVGAVLIAGAGRRHGDAA